MGRCKMLIKIFIKRSLTIILTVSLIVSQIPYFSHAEEDQYRYSGSSFDTGPGVSFQDYQQKHQNFNNFVQRQNLRYNLPEIVQPKIPTINTFWNSYDFLEKNFEYKISNIEFNKMHQIKSFNLSTNYLQQFSLNSSFQNITYNANNNPLGFTEIISYPNPSGQQLTRFWHNAVYEQNPMYAEYHEKLDTAQKNFDRRVMLELSNKPKPAKEYLRAFKEELRWEGKKPLHIAIKEIQHDQYGRVAVYEAYMRDAAGNTLDIGISTVRNRPGKILSFKTEISDGKEFNIKKEWNQESSESLNNILSVLLKNKIPLLLDETSWIRLKDLKILRTSIVPDKDGSMPQDLSIQQIKDNLKQSFEPKVEPKIEIEQTALKTKVPSPQGTLHHGITHQGFIKKFISTIKSFFAAFITRIKNFFASKSVKKQKINKPVFYEDPVGRIFPQKIATDKVTTKTKVVVEDVLNGDTLIIKGTIDVLNNEELLYVPGAVFEFMKDVAIHGTEYNKGLYVIDLEGSLMRVDEIKTALKTIHEKLNNQITEAELNIIQLATELEFNVGPMLEAITGKGLVLDLETLLQGYLKVVEALTVVLELSQTDTDEALKVENYLVLLQEADGLQHDVKPAADVLKIRLNEELARLKLFKDNYIGYFLTATPHWADWLKGQPINHLRINPKSVQQYLDQKEKLLPYIKKAMLALKEFKKSEIITEEQYHNLKNNLVINAVTVINATIETAVENIAYYTVQGKEKLSVVQEAFLRLGFYADLGLLVYNVFDKNVLDVPFKPLGELAEKYPAFGKIIGHAGHKTAIGLSVGSFLFFLKFAPVATVLGTGLMVGAPYVLKKISRGSLTDDQAQFWGIIVGLVGTSKLAQSKPVVKLNNKLSILNWGPKLKTGIQSIGNKIFQPKTSSPQNSIVSRMRLTLQDNREFMRFKFNGKNPKLAARTLNTTIQEIAKERGGLLTTRDMANIQKWQNKIGDTALSKKTQNLIFNSYKEVIKKDPWFVFDRSKLDSRTKYMINEYIKGRVGAKARELAPKLDKMNNKEFLKFMDREYCDKTKTKDIFIRNEIKISQEMIKYEYKDGTVIRYKPLGDKLRDGPTYSIEVKKNIAKPDIGFDSAAFKVDKNGNPFPKHFDNINRPLPKDKIKYSMYKDFHKMLDDYIMGKVHRLLPE